MPCGMASPATAMQASVRVDCAARPHESWQVVSDPLESRVRQLHEVSSSWPRGQDRVYQLSDRGQLSSLQRGGMHEDRCSLPESIEVNTQFVKQYPRMHAAERGWDGTVPEAWHAASQDLAGVEGIAQTIPDVVDGDHREENHQPWEKRPVRCQIQIIFGIRQNPAPRRHIWGKP